MTFIEKTGKSVDEAVAEALKELKISREEAVVEIIDEPKKGFLGFGKKDAKVRVCLKSCAANQSNDKSELEEAADRAFSAIKDVAHAAASEVEDKFEEAKRDLAEIVDDAADRAKEFKEAALDSTIGKLQSVRDEENGKERDFAGGQRKYAVSEPAINASKEFLQKIFGAMKLEVVMEKFINKNDGSVVFKLHGKDMGILIGKHGQTLDSLQYLTNLVANKNSDERVRVIIDVEDYRDRRVETLTRLAHRLADKVKRTGERVELEPMNPHERKIIHMALQNDRKVVTSSEGEEPSRCVVIELKK